MKIAVFTANQPRHFSLIRMLAGIADDVLACQECYTLFPGHVADFYRKSDVMQRYFDFVRRAEEEVFDPISLLPPNVRILPLRDGDINKLPVSIFSEFLSADLIVVFGATYLKGDLCDALIARNAINIHMGVSPYYRGSSCNFWAMYDGNYDMVGATIHRLSGGLDSGSMLFHAFPEAADDDPWCHGMKAVKAAHKALALAISGNRLTSMQPVVQDRSKQIRYTKTSEFTDEVAQAYLDNLPSADRIRSVCERRDYSKFLRPSVA